MTLQESLKKITAWNAMGRPVTIEMDGVEVAQAEVFDDPEAEVQQLISAHGPSVTKVYYLNQNGERNGKLRWKKIPNNIDVIKGGMGNLPKSDYAVVEEENGQPVKPSSPLAPQAIQGNGQPFSTSGSTADFAYQMTFSQLMEAKQRIAILEKETRDQEKDIVAKDRKILDLEHTNDSLNEKLNSNEGLSGLMKNPDTLGAILGNLPTILAAFKGGGGGQMAGASQLDQYLAQLPPEAQADTLDLVETMVAMYMQGQPDVLPRVRATLLAQAHREGEVNGGAAQPRTKTF